MKNNRIKTSIIIQARMGSTRLPGKILKPILGRPLLSLLLERVRRVHAMHSLIIATTTKPEDDIFESFCKEENVAIFRGSEENVLNRYYQAALKSQAETIVRITSDCPLIDPAIIDQALLLYAVNSNCVDYVSNTLKRTFPRGMDVEVFSFEALKKAEEETKELFEKEHVTPYIYQHPDLFRLINFTHEPDLSNYRLTVDTNEDLMLITKIYEALYAKNRQFTMQDIIKNFDTHPEWININAHIKQKEVK